MKVMALLGGAGALGLSGCSSRQVQESSSEASSASGSAPGAITVTDQFGRTVTFDKTVERIATTVIPAPSMIIAADQGISKITAVNKAAQMQAKNGMLATMFPEIMDLPIAAQGSDFVPNIETISQTNPDVVIQWGQYGEDITVPIEQAGLKMLLLQYGTQEDLETWVTLFTTILGKEERGQQIIQRMHDDRALVEAAVKKAGSKKRVMQVYSYSDFKVSAGGSYMDFWINLAGGENVGRNAPEGSSSSVAKEEVLTWDPEVIFLGNFDPVVPEDIYKDPFFAEVTAVKNKQVYKVPNGGFAWDPPCNESNLMWKWASSLIHPEHTDFDLRADLKDTFTFLYDYQLKDEEIDQILRVEVNSKSKNYDRFTA